MPVPQQQQVKQSTDVEVVRAKIKRYHRGARTPKARHNRNYNKRSAWHGQNRSNWRGHQARNYRYWHGHRGYNYYRPGYRRYDGFWFPAAAFTTGVVIGTTVTRGNAHVRWCSNQYVSYRVSDNTFQPYDGPRRQCVSP